jgi:hypothetical protein
MGIFEMIVAIVFITSIAEVVKAFAKGRTQTSSKDKKELLAAVEALREEMRQLRQENHDVLLGVDGAVEKMERRLTHIEQARLAAGSAAPAESETAAQVVGRIR